MTDSDIVRLEKKIDFVSEQLDLVLKSNCHLRGDIAELIPKSMKTVLDGRNREGYSKIAGGR